MSASIHETSERVYLENIPPMKFGEQMDNTFVRSVQLSLNALGENYTYDYMMGISGAAFRLHFDPKWCPSSTDATCGFDVSEVIFKSLGYNVNFKRINHNSFEDIKSLYKMIKIQVDKGLPLVSINLKGNMDWGIITGYLKNEPGILCRTFYDETDEYSVASRAPWLNFFIGEKKPGLASGELFYNSLKIAVRLARTKKYDEYYSGFYAFEKWIDQLGKAMESYPPEDLAQIMEIHFIIYNALLDGRRSVIKYLSDKKNGETTRNINQVIDTYTNIVRILESSDTNPVEKSVSDPTKQMNHMIQGQIEKLAQILDLEKKAIHLIKEEINT